jgi:hypothetical protein
MLRLEKHIPKRMMIKTPRTLPTLRDRSTRMLP